MAPLPPELKSLGSENDIYKHMINEALKSGQLPDDGDYRNLATRVFSLSATMLDSVQQMADAHFAGDLKAGFVGLCRLGVSLSMKVREAAQKPHSAMDDVPAGFTPKSDQQAQFYSLIANSLAHKRIVFAEASTGIGKGRAIVAAALNKARTLNESELTVICGPTVAIVEQLYQEALSFAAHDIELRILCGASEFVDDMLLQAYLEENQDPIVEPVRQWVQSGALPLNPTRPLVQSIGPTAAWLRDDLRLLCEEIGIEADDFTLSTDVAADSASRRIVQGIRAAAANETRIVFCTHAMLATAQKTQWKLMPAPAVVLVDEAHLFEMNISGVNHEMVSLLTLRSVLARYRRANKLSASHACAKAHTAAMQLSKTLSGIGKQFEAARIGMHDLDIGVQRLVHAQIGELLAYLGVPSMANVPMTTIVKRQLAGIRKQIEEHEQPGLALLRRVNISFSPSRHYPSLISGPVTVNAQLGGIWKAAREGVVLASATLYTPNEAGDLRCDYMRTVLNTPLARTDIKQPIIDPQIYSLPTLHIPSKATAAQLRPFTEGSERLEWCKRVADTLVTHVAPLSRGGTLVLLTSYSDIKAVAQAIESGHTGFKQPVLRMERGVGFTHVKREFRKLYAQGHRPLLLGLGTAWTGVDFSIPEVSAEDDLLLTALVVARIPIGTNDSNTMRERVALRGMHVATQEAALMFKQGLGRLIRRHDVIDRHLWVLDGRLYDAKPWSTAAANNTAFTHLTASLRRLLLRYTKRTEF